MDDKISGVFFGGGKIELFVFVGFGCRGYGFFGGVEGVFVSYVDFVLFKYNLVGKVVVDIGSFFCECGGLVDRIFGFFGSFEWCIGGVFVDGDYVKSGVVVFVKEDFVVLFDNDDILRVDGMGGVY